MSASPQTICVTGSAGFVASHIIAALLEQGHRVRATVRDRKDTARRAHLDALGASHEDRLRVFSADLVEPGSFDEPLRGSDALVHCAAVVKLTAADPQREIVDVAVRGTEQLLESAAKTPTLRRVVMTSSVAAITSPDRPPGTQVDESDWCDSTDVQRNAYGIAKAQSERALWRFAERVRDRVATVAINPSMVVGPPLAPHHTEASIVIVRDLLARTYPALPRIHFSVVDVRDVVEAHLRALEPTKADGKRIIVAARSMWLAELAAVLASEYKVPQRDLPNALFYLAAVFDRRLSIATAKSWLRTRFQFESRRAQELLGLEYHDVEVSLLECARTMLDAGWARGRSK